VTHTDKNLEILEFHNYFMIEQSYHFAYSYLV